MTAKLLEGRPLAKKIETALKREVSSLGKSPVLACVQVGHEPGQEAYVKSQKKTTEGLGVKFQLHKLPADTSESALMTLIKKLNSDTAVNGIIVQMPLPAQIDHKKISRFIAPEKDVECMHPLNIGKIAFANAVLLPCTPAAVMELLDSCCPDLCGKEVVIVGHSEIVGKPLANLLLERLATVTICHIGTSKVGKLREHVERAQILIVAAGKTGLIKGEWIREGTIVIDVGINKVADKIVGDVEFDKASKRAGFITPVPGGVGPLTVIMLMRNLIEAVKLQGRPKTARDVY